MNFNIDIQDKNKITIESISQFLEDLIRLNILNSNNIKYISYDHYDTSLGRRVGESYYPKNLQQALDIIANNDIKFLTIVFFCSNYYQGDNSDFFSKIMHYLNIISSEITNKYKGIVKIDFYLSIYFKNGVYETEWGKKEICQLSFIGDGGYVAEEDIYEILAIFTETMKEDCPELFILFEIMEVIFGKVKFSLGYSIF